MCEQHTHTPPGGVRSQRAPTSLIRKSCRVHRSASAFICVHLWFQNPSPRGSEADDAEGVGAMLVLDLLGPMHDADVEPHAAAPEERDAGLQGGHERLPGPP